MLLCAESGVFAVADGLGGLDAGDLASRIALARLELLLCGPVEEDRCASTCPAAIRNRRTPTSILETIGMVNLHTYEQKIRLGKNMATTLAMLQFQGEAMIVAHVGDSRIYLWRDGLLHRLTSDHSLINELQEKGALTPGQTEQSCQRHIITRAMGAERSVQPSITQHSLKTQDLLLLCTDGLTSMLSDRQIAQILQTKVDEPASTVQNLVRTANEAGGHDNITVIAVAIKEERSTVLGN